MKLEIHWNKLSLAEWDSRFNSIKRSNILQSYDYAIASARHGLHRARWGLIVIDGQDAGLVQILEASIFFKAFHAVMVDRGPLWFDGFGGAAHIKAFFDAMQYQFPKRFGRRRRFIPEIEDGATAKAIIKQAGLKLKLHQQQYQSLWWDLRVDDQDARMNLKSSWRGSLHKAEKSGISITWDDTLKSYKEFKAHYVADKAVRGYHGVSPKLLDNLAIVSTKRPFMVIGKASYDGEDSAAILILRHGQSATYQIGWSLDKGRKYCAHHLLLWRARQYLRGHGINDFDLGGINDEESAIGIKNYKIGTGATPYKLVGLYE